MDLFRKRLQLLLDEKDMSQKELAKMSGVTEVTISRYMNGSRKPRIEIANKIAQVLDTTTDYLLGNSDIRNPYTNNINEEELTPEEIELLETIKNDPELSILFHDLKSAPKKKVKQLLDTWEFVNKQFDDMEKDLDDNDR